MPTTYWSPNQALVAQVETYTYTVPSSVGNTYTATINGKSVTYTSVSGDTAATVATNHMALLAATQSVPVELNEISFTNPSSAVVVATARTPGTPFANVTVNGVSGQGLVMSTGNGLVNGIATAHTTPNASPSDVFDSQNWLRVIGSAPGVRAIPVSGDDVVVSNSGVPLLWNLDRLSNVEFGTYKRWQNFTASIGLPLTNPAGYTEWRATYFKFNGPQGSVPSGGLDMVLGFSSGSGSGPSRERYDLQSSQYTLTALASGSAQDDFNVVIKGVHTANVMRITGPVSVGMAMVPGDVAGLSSSLVDGGGSLSVGPGLVWTAGSTLSVVGGSVLLNSAPATLALSNGSQAVFTTDALTWAAITAQGGCNLIWLAGGTITNLTLSTSSSLDKSQDSRALTITNSTIDGDTCVINDPLNAMVFTNPTSVREQVASGPFRFTGTRTVRVL